MIRFREIPSAVAALSTPELEKLMVEIAERWRPVVGFPEYEVSDQGRVRSLPRVVVLSRPNGVARQRRNGAILKPGLDGKGYPMVVMCDQGRRVTRRCHLLVLEAFVGLKPDGQEALHGDGDSGNPKLENLRWGTSAENRADAMAHGTAYTLGRGEAHAMAKLSAAQVSEIKWALTDAPRGAGAALAKKYGVSQSAISKIKNGDTWA